MERPALQRLLADIEAGKVDAVVVYKVDRLTRSLADFAKIVELFDAARRLLRLGDPALQHHHLDGPADAERAAVLRPVRARGHRRAHPRQDRRLQAKGMWMGGMPPLGYDVSDRKLVVNEAEAETVRHIFRRYVALGSVRLLAEDSKLMPGSVASGGRAPPAVVDGGVNPRINGDDRKAGTRFAACDQPLPAIYRSDANGCPVALCQRRQPPKAGAVGQRCVLGMSSSLGVKVPCAT